MSKTFCVRVAKYFELSVEAENEEEACLIAEDEMNGRDFNDGNEDVDVWEV